MAKMDNRTADVHVTNARSVRKMSAIDWIPMLLLIVGGVNWGLVGLFDFDLVAYLFGAMTGLARVVYVLVGLSALYAIYLCSKMSGDRT